MRISSKGRYALAAAINMAKFSNGVDPVTVVSISERLGISKIYLEQVFALLRRGGVVNSVKGAQGGYVFTRLPSQITAYDILSAAEISLFEATEETVAHNSPETDEAMQSLVFGPLDDAVIKSLSTVTLEDLVHETEKLKGDQSLMFFI